MCGIAGYFQCDSTRFNEADLRIMSQTIRHRGPDATGFFTDATVGLVHNRLSIIDLNATANQPMHSADGRYVIAYNGEVYNFNELAQEHHLQCKTTSDTEVVLELFSKYSTAAIEQFNGMFAFAMYDKHQQTLWLVRDRMSVKPLFYFWDGTHFAFASEIKALRSLKHINQDNALNHQAINAYLHLGYIPEPLTIWQNIYKFPSGSFAKVQGKTFEITRYWNPAEKIEKDTISNEMQAKEQLRDLVVSSIRYRLKSDVPYGTFLSGGIDSSLVTAVAQQQLSKPLNTFSIAFPDSKHNEAGYAKEVAKYLHTNHHELIVTEKDALALTEEMLDLYDEPFADSSAIPTMLVSKFARQHVTMTLTGDGGDELFMGYGMYTWAQRMQNPLLQAARKPIYAALSCLGNRQQRAAQLFNYPSKEELKSHIFSQEQYLFSKQEICKLLKPEYLQASSVIDDYSNLQRTLSAKEEQAFFDLNYYLKDDLLVKVDRASMYYSLEAREPLLDYHIVEFALNLDESLKVHGKTSKYLLKEVLYDFVPAQLFNRPKWGFSIPLETWLKGELRYLIDEYLNKTVINQFGIVDYTMVEQLKKQYLEKDKSYVYNRLWQLIVLHRFLVKNK